MARFGVSTSQNYDGLERAEDFVCIVLLTEQFSNIFVKDFSLKEQSLRSITIAYTGDLPNQDIVLVRTVATNLELEPGVIVDDVNNSCGWAILDTELHDAEIVEYGNKLSFEDVQIPKEWESKFTVSYGTIGFHNRIYALGIMAPIGMSAILKYRLLLSQVELQNFINS